MTTEHVRKELLKMHDSDRKNMRCVMTQELTTKANELTAQVDKDESSTVEMIATMNAELKELNTELVLIQQLRRTMLEDAKLYNMHKSYSCSISELHPSLIEFDDESDRLRKDILLMI